MVNINYFIVVCLLLLWPLGLKAAEFSASVNSTTVEVGEPFTLKLKLSGAGVKRRPDSSIIPKEFSILGTGQQTSISISNGKRSDSLIWSYNLAAIEQGTFIIPAFTLDTDQGNVVSEPITIEVTKATSPPPQIQVPNKTPMPKVTQDPGADQVGKLKIESDISKRSPYVNETIEYTIRIISTGAVADATVEAPEFKDAVIEESAKPNKYERTRGGVREQVTEISVMITPLEAGKLVIPGTTLKGRIRKPVANFFPQMQFGTLGSGFSVRSSIGNRYEPFKIKSDDIVLDVKSPAADMDPWLPATSVGIIENWDKKQVAKVGEPLTRGLTVVAKGTVSSQLPDLSNRQGDAVKVYADKPTLGQEFENGKITSWRNETYTLVPTREGKIILPAIEIAWWDVSRDQLTYSKLPPRELNVLAGIQPPSPSTPPPVVQQPQSQPQVPIEKSFPFKSWYQKAQAMYQHVLHYKWFYVVLLIGLLLALKLGNYRKKRGSGSRNHKEKKEQSVVKVPIKDINAAKDNTALRIFLQKYAHSYWNLPMNASLTHIGAIWSEKLPKKQQEIKSLCKKLDAACYANETLDIKAWKRECVSLLKIVRKEKPKSARDIKSFFRPLNPN